MKKYELSKRQYINRPLSEVFAFFQQPENLCRITPPWLDFQILTPRPIVMNAGVTIDYKVRPFFWPVSWTSLIKSYDPPHSFVDVQVRGPYVLWEHTHKFHSESGGTWVEDQVVYALPFGIVGRIANRVEVRAQLEEIFQYRNKMINEIFK